MISTTIRYAARPPRQYGDRMRINVVCDALDQNGKEIKLWGNPDDAIANLKKGEKIQICNNHERWELVPQSEAIPLQTTHTAPLAMHQPAPGNGHTPPGVIAMQTPVSHPAKPALNADVREWISIFEELRAALPQAQETTWRAAASTLFIQRLQIRADFNQEVF